MKKICALLTFLFFVGIFIPAVSAEIIIDEQLGGWTHTSGRYTLKFELHNRASEDMKYIGIRDISLAQTLNFVTVTVSGNKGSLATGEYPITYTLGGVTKSGTLYVTKYNNLIGQVTHTRFQLFFYDWDIGNLQGPQIITLNRGLWKTEFYGKFYWPTTSIDSNIIFGCGLYSNNFWTTTESMDTVYVSGIDWNNHLIVTHNNDDSYKVDLKRLINGKNYASTLTVKDISDSVTYTVYGNDDVSQFFYSDEISTISVISPSNDEYTYNIAGAPGPDGPDEPTVIVYIKNSQTGALIANSNIVIDALVDGEYYPVVNRTEPSGIFSITLQPTGGGHPNPDGYRLIATADGYNNPMPEINFTVDDYKQSIYCLLDPIAGGPVNENKTFIDFFVSDMYANPISGATVKFGKYTLITNIAGYTVFEVDKSNTYTWIVSKSGYGTLTGNAVIGDAPRHTINTVLAPAVTPVKPTPTPPSTPIKPTPIMTAPTGEPVSNWLEWFASHFGMILGGGVEIGKIFMWLCFAVPVGVYVGKEAKAGAAGFMAGAGVVTLFFVLIGWVPIWLLVLLALIIGLLYAKVFNTPDNGGGR